MSGGEVKGFGFSPSQAELELVQLLLEQDQVSYPQNPAASEADAFFAQVDQAFSLDDWSDAEMAERASRFTHHLNQLWETPSLLERFATRMPQNLLQAIATQAQQAIASNLSLLDRLVQCVQDVVPNWGEDDLQVFARPLAYAMRDTESNPVEATLGTVRSVDWTDLSDVEQARLSLAVARYALDQLEQDAAS